MSGNMNGIDAVMSAVASTEETPLRTSECTKAPVKEEAKEVAEPAPEKTKPTEETPAEPRSEAPPPETQDEIPADDSVKRGEPVKEESAEAPAPQKEPTPAAAKNENDPSGKAAGEVAEDSSSKLEANSETNLGGAARKVEDAMDVEDQDTSQTEQAEESAASKELPYSTRGRSNDTGSGTEKREQSARESLEEIGRVKEHTTAASLGTSFLESLSEEERRTRTRFLPDVDGMHSLRKVEVREDLALARSLVSAAGVTSLKKSKSKRSRSDEDAMDVDGEGGGTSPSEDDRSSDIARLGTSTVELPSRDMVVPSNAFVAPTGANSEDTSEGQSVTSAKSQNGVQSPLLVEAVVAFNPPRPPESIGAKKKHRMLRWERRPEDVEVDLNNYRKTVQRTRQELHSAEAEYDRLENVDAHLRWHFLGHLNLMNDEYMRLNEELGSVQQECVKSADLLTSRTRSRGAVKASCVMRDVLAVLKSRGNENKDSMETEAVPVISNPAQTTGIGGLTLASFCDWDRGTTFTPTQPANAWVVPGEKVKTPYGEGEVVEVFPAETVIGDVSDAIKDADRVKQNGNKNKPDSTKPKRKKDGSKSDKKGANKVESEMKSSYPTSIRLPRVSVRLPFGIGHFVVDVISPVENPAVLSDTKLAKRWKDLVASALSVSGCLDLEGMSSKVEETTSTRDDSDKMENEDNSPMHISDVPGNPKVAKSDDIVGTTKTSTGGKFLPFGSGLLPTSSGRGNLLPKLSITDIEKGMNSALFAGGGVLGKTSNPGVTAEFRKAEDEEQEYLTLQASVLQLRNALVRQKRIRLLNERTSVATTERYHRAEDLVAEMRADLKSLKHRLEEELTELGIDEASAEQILSSFYYGQEAPSDVGEASPLKRKRRSLSRDEHENAADDSDNPAKYGDEIDRESVDDQGFEDLSGDDLEGHRASKKIRPNQ